MVWQQRQAKSVVHIVNNIDDDIKSIDDRVFSYDIVINNTVSIVKCSHCTVNNIDTDTNYKEVRHSEL